MTTHAPRRPQKISLLLSDVDGTLVTTDKVLTEGTRRAVHRLRDAGVRFAITSSRPPRGLEMLIEPLALDTTMGAFNGGAYATPRLEIIEERTIEPQAAQRALQTIEAHRIDPWVFSGSDWLILRPSGPYVEHEHRTVLFAPTVVAEFGRALDRATKIVGVSDDFDRVERCEADLQQGLGTGATAIRSQRYYVDVTHPEANKGMVLDFLARTMEIAHDEIVTIGDGSNDVAMFRKCGFAIAMGNADDEVKAEADAVTDSNEANGFAEAVERFILGCGAS
jgi:Cof subfamily protein (haloacid dehalogenase superfamily)